MTEDEIVRYHHQLNGFEFEQAPGVGDGREGLVCCSPWGRKEVCDLFSLTEYLLHDGCFYTFNFETSSLRMAVSSPLKQIER